MKEKRARREQQKKKKQQQLDVNSNESRLMQYFNNRCKTCSHCLLKDCGSCEACCNNKSYTRPYRENCIRKICVQLLNRKIQARGFPPGWNIEEVKELASSSQHDDDGSGTVNHHEFTITSPNGHEYPSIEDALDSEELGLNDDDKDTTISALFKQLGTDYQKVLVIDHPLREQGYCREWISHRGEKVVLFGTIKDVQQKGIDSKISFTVEYSQSSRRMINSHYSVFPDMEVPRVETISEDCAWGGCILYREKRKLSKNKAFRRQYSTGCPRIYRIPDLYRNPLLHQTQFQQQQQQEEIITQQQSNTLPTIILHYAGFELVFRVKHSSIPNAGFGVFLSCTPLLLDGKDQESSSCPIFSLKPGEMLDFGVYAPFLSQDKKRDHIIMVKSFLFEFECESYSFSTNQAKSVYDITDDRTGKLHKHAQQHVPPFINETTRWKTNIPEVHAMYDPQGSLHYYLGYEERSFQILADGREREIFVDYGERYEIIRLRQGYPRVQLTSQQVKERLEAEEMEYMDEFLAFTATEIKEAFVFLEDVLKDYAGTEEDHFQKIRVMARGLAICILLRSRVVEIQETFSTLSREKDSSFVCAHGAFDINPSRMAISFSKVISTIYQDLEKLYGSYLQSYLLTQTFFVSALKLAIQKHDVESNVSLGDPALFENFVCQGRLPE